MVKTMIKLLIGGSPCTFWSIAQKNGRETEAEGMGWELFKNYLIAKEKFKPDFFLYENNKSAAQAIKDQISRELGVELMYINSALVSAQNRQRFYAFNWEVEQPKDRGILLRDILETGTDLSQNEKSYCLTASYNGACAWNTLERSQRTMVAEPIDYKVREGSTIQVTENNIHGLRKNGATEAESFVYYPDGKTNALLTGHIPKIIEVEPKRIPEYGVEDKSRPVTASYAYKGSGTGSLLSEAFPSNPNKQVRDYVAVPVNVTDVPCMPVKEATKQGYAEIEPGDCVDMTMPNSKTRRGRSMKEKCNCLMTGNQYYQYIGTKDNPIYEVKNGLITIKDKQYPIKLVDGYYIIRKLTVTECCRLQTMPDDYCKAVSNSQAYKGLGNGWTAEVIMHILNGALKDVPRDEEIVVLSMYDGIGTGRYCLDKMGFTNVKYYAYEIDRYAKQIAMSNYPDIIQMGDAFDLRHPDWTIGY